MPLLSITFNCSSLCLGFGDIDVPINLKFLSGCSSMIDSTPRTCRKDEIFLWEMIGFVSSVILVLLKIMITYSGPAPSEGPAGRPLVFNLALTLISTPSLLVSRTQLQQAFFQRSFYNDSLADLEAAQQEFFFMESLSWLIVQFPGWIPFPPKCLGPLSPVAYIPLYSSLVNIFSYTNKILLSGLPYCFPITKENLDLRKPYNSSNTCKLNVAYSCTETAQQLEIFYAHKYQNLGGADTFWGDALRLTLQLWPALIQSSYPLYHSALLFNLCLPYLLCWYYIASSCLFIFFSALKTT